MSSRQCTAHREGTEGCVLYADHDGAHVWWHQSATSPTARHSGVWFYEDDGKAIAHADFDGKITAEQAAALFAILTVARDPARVLPPEEVAEYERCQQSVIDARRSAERNEGQRWIG